MLIDFQQHYTPPELLKGDTGKVTVDVDVTAIPIICSIRSWPISRPISA